MLLFIGLMLLGTSSPVLIGDGAVRFEAVNELASAGTLSEMKYSFIGPVFSAPLWFLGRVSGSPEYWVSRYNLLLFFMGLGVMWVLLEGHLDRALIRKFLLLLMAASMFPAHLLQFYGEVFTSLLVGIGLLAVIAGGTGAGWIAIVIGVANTPATLGALAITAFKRSFDLKRWRYALVIGPAFALIAAETWLRRGELVVSDYLGDHGFRTVLPYSGGVGFSYPLFFGLLSVLFSFGKGILFFAPGFVLPIRSKLREMSNEMWATYALWLAFLIGLVLVYSRWWSWYGGFFWGPRFFLFASLPATLALAVRVHKPSRKAGANLITAGALILSGWVAISGFVYEQANLGICADNLYALEHLCWYVPEFSALWRPFVVTTSLSAHDIAYISFVSIVLVRMLAPLSASFLEAIRAAGTRFTDAAGWRF
jgi:hypothetical protein